jgi:hypothetical protein
MALGFSEAYAGIDWARGYEFLDKELQQVVRDAELGRRLADKLVKVWRVDGEAEMEQMAAQIAEENVTYEAHK